MHIPTYVNSAAPKYRTRLRSREPDLHSRGIRNHGRMALAEDGGHLRDCPGVNLEICGLDTLFHLLYRRTSVYF